MSLTGPTYPAARAIAGDIEEHFGLCAAKATESGAGPVAPAPDAATIEAILSAAFWGSLRREEGRSPRISIAYLPPELATDPLLLGQPLPLEPGSLTRLAPAVERPSIHLGVWHRPGGLSIWGMTRWIPASTFVVEVIEPGLLVVKRRRGREGAKFANVAVLQGDRVMRVDENAAALARFSAMTAALLGNDSQLLWVDPLNVLVQLAVSMRAHAHGGTLLLVPDETERWRESMVHPIPYPVDPPFTRLAELAGRRPHESDQATHTDVLRRTVAAVAGLTSVDGATVLTQRYRLLAFGAKIGRRWDSPPVDRVRLAEPLAGYEPHLLDSAQLGGTRHLSAAQFALDQPDALALVSSQDGRFTVFARDPDDPVVHAYRIDALLL